MQDVTVRQLSLNLWGSNCGYTAQGNSFPGSWLGPATVSMLPFTCGGSFSSQGVSYTFGWTSASPNAVLSSPPFDMQVSMQSVNGAPSGLATGGQIMGYLSALGTTSLITNLTGNANDTLTWMYNPPPVVQISIVPVGGCPDGSTTCLTPAATCNPAASANASTVVSNVLNGWDLSNLEGNVPSTYPSQVRRSCLHCTTKPP